MFIEGSESASSIILAAESVKITSQDGAVWQEWDSTSGTIKSYATIYTENIEGDITDGAVLDMRPITFDGSGTPTQEHVLVNFLKANGFPIKGSCLRSRKQEEVLHKPISNLKEVLECIKLFNKNLYLCALLTYGCLLRPHQEIRRLKWRDFSDDLSFISLSGNKVKSKRNRVVPVPEYIRKELVKGEVNNNIFTDTSKPYNNSYFKGVWRRFKRCLPSVERDITLYSFRHTGAIEIYKRTGSLSKLQKAMGHSSLKVSLTYLRGLEVEDLKEEDMPMV